MVLSVFYVGRTESCMELAVHRVSMPFQGADLRNSPSAASIQERHTRWKERLPQSDKDVWDALQQLDGGEQASLFAHCAAYSRSEAHTSELQSLMRISNAVFCLQKKKNN